MSDALELLREKELGREKNLEIQTKALSSPWVYEVFCYSQNLLLAQFIVWGAKEEKLKKVLQSNFLYFNINSEGSGEFYFKKRLIPLLDKINAWSEPLIIMDYSDLPITSFMFKKLQSMDEREDKK